ARLHNWEIASTYSSGRLGSLRATCSAVTRASSSITGAGGASSLSLAITFCLCPGASPYTAFHESPDRLHLIGTGVVWHVKQAEALCAGAGVVRPIGDLDRTEF